MNWITWRRASVTLIIGLASACVFVGWILRAPTESADNVVHAGHKSEGPKESSDAPLKVDVVSPREGGVSRISVQPGSIHAFEATQLYANISGYLQVLHVDIGDRVTAGQLLIEIAAPELLSDVDRSKAAVDRALAEVQQMKSRVKSAEAELHVAETGITRAEAAVKRDTAAFEFRNKQFKRFRELANDKSIDERLVDEKEDQRLAAMAAVDASNANLAESKALVVSAAAKVDQAKADLTDAEAHVEVARADLGKARVFADYTQIRAPYDGVVSTRGFVRGDYIRAASGGGVSVPLLTVERTDLFRLVIYMPDNDTPFTNPGDETVSEIEALPGHKFTGNVSRIAASEDMKTRTMRTEIDLKNEQGLLRNGMYTRTRLTLQPGNPKAFSIPSNALIGPAKDGRGTVFIVRDNIAHKTTVTLGTDNGIQVEVTEGIAAHDQVIVGNNNSLADGRRVEVNKPSATNGAKSKNHSATHH